MKSDAQVVVVAQPTEASADQGRGDEHHARSGVVERSSYLLHQLAAEQPGRAEGQHQDDEHEDGDLAPLRLPEVRPATRGRRARSRR